MPSVRSIVPIAEAKYWQYPRWLTVRKYTTGQIAGFGTAGGSSVYWKKAGLRRCCWIAVASS